MRSIPATLAVATALLVPGSVAAHNAPHFVLVSRVWHVGAIWDSVIEGPEQKGFEAIAANLSGQGADADCAGVIFGYGKSVFTKAVKNIDENVIPVGDSAAGVLWQEAAVDVTVYLEAVVFGNAFLIEDGTSLANDMLSDIVRASMETAAVLSDNSLPVDQGICRHILLVGVSDNGDSAIIDMMIPQSFGFHIRQTPAVLCRSIPSILFCSPLTINCFPMMSGVAWLSGQATQSWSMSRVVTRRF